MFIRRLSHSQEKRPGLRDGRSEEQLRRRQMYVVSVVS